MDASLCLQEYVQGDLGPSAAALIVDLLPTQAV